jgi:hypothetical protein
MNKKSYILLTNNYFMGRSECKCRSLLVKQWIKDRALRGSKQGVIL